MTILELKKYIYKENKVELILENLGCHHIKFHKNNKHDYYSCGNPDGDNQQAITIKYNEYLNCENYTRNINVVNDDNDKKDNDIDNTDIITLVQFIRKETFFDSIKYIHNLLGLKITYKHEIPKVNKIDPLNIFKKVKSSKTKCNVLDFRTYDNEDLFYDIVPYIHKDLYLEGILSNTIKEFGLGYSFKYKRTIFPLRYWLDGSLLGTNARTSVKNYDDLNIKKYYLTPSYPKSLNLYGLWENKNHIEKEKKITLFEAEKSVLKRHSRLDKTCVALSGHTISEEQIRIILGLDITEIVIALDKDIDINEIRYMCEKFYRIRKVSYIYDKYDLLKEKDSPADVNNKIYEFLFKHRIVYDENEHKKFINWINKDKR